MKKLILLAVLLAFGTVSAQTKKDTMTSKKSKQDKTMMHKSSAKMDKSKKTSTMSTKNEPGKMNADGTTRDDSSPSGTTTTTTGNTNGVGTNSRPGEAPATR